MELPRSAARLNRDRCLNKRNPRPQSLNPNWFHSPRAYNTISKAPRMTSPNHEHFEELSPARATTPVTANSSRGRTANINMPLRPLNINFEEPSTTKCLSKKTRCGQDDRYGYRPSPIQKETVLRTFVVAPPSPVRTEYSEPRASSFPKLEDDDDEDNFISSAGYLEHDFDDIPPPPPFCARRLPAEHVDYYHYGRPAPPPPPPQAYYEEYSYGSYNMTMYPMTFPDPSYERDILDGSPQNIGNLRDATVAAPRPVFVSPPPAQPPSRPPTPCIPGTPGELRELDIVCGRGAPTNFHYGNQVFKDVIEEHQTTYLLAKRSDKPNLAMKILDLMKDNGSRFVRREKTAGRFAWVEIDSRAAYDKVCQALREGAPDVRRKALSATAKKAAKK